ncbi:MAG: MATE family efflux transporter [Bacteroidales bacterium]|jgi:MATE family multidrug resistance protein|nr:MATE family efflux transporter [Bacteroidales bacterium]
MNKSILRLAVPNIISNITVPILGMVDIALMGHLESAVYIGAIGLGSVIFNVLYLSLGFLRMGTTGFTAQAYGKSDNAEIAHGLYRAFGVAFVLALLLIMFQLPIEKLSFYLLNGSEEVKSLAREYFYIRIYAAPATLGIFVLMGWLVGLQNTVLPMILSIAINVLNIGFNLYFVQVLKMDVAGVALGTVLSQYGGMVLGIFIVIRKYGHKLQPLKMEVLLQVEQLSRFFKVNRDILIRSVLLILTLSFFTSESAGMGDQILAVNSMMLQYFFVFSYFMDGFAYAGEALIGKHIGKNDKKMLSLTVKKLLMWGLILSLPFMLFYGLAHQSLFRLITDNDSLIQLAERYRLWLILIPITTFSAFIWDGIYIGATASVSMRNTMLIASLIVFFPCWYFLQPLYFNHGLWIAFHAFMLSRGVLMTLFSSKALAFKWFRV